MADVSNNQLVSEEVKLPSGQFIAVSHTERNYEESLLYCKTRGMVAASIHSQDDADALEHLLIMPTYLGATETGGKAQYQHSGTWTWEDGSEWDFQHESTSNDNHMGDDGIHHGCRSVEGCGNIQDETHMVAVPGTWVQTIDFSFDPQETSSGRGYWADWVRLSHLF